MFTRRESLTVPDEQVAYPDFASIWARAEAVPGWLTRAQAQELWDVASAVPAGGTALEIGSHQGRSTLVLAAALAARGAQLTAVDPFVEGRLFGGASTRSRFEANVAASGLDATVTLLAERSTDVRPAWTEPLSLVYIDGKHDYWTVSDDLRWLAFLPADGVAVIHDAFSSIGVTLALTRRVLPSAELTYVRRTGSLAVLRRQPPDAAARLRFLGQAPWFARNVGIKIALRVGRIFGRQRPDPY